ncbi:MAG: hypothetical protein H0X63_10255 [Flavobacteriales bacterium]|nr:hypothetical protein [Flavobacteriales bacterium]
MLNKKTDYDLQFIKENVISQDMKDVIKSREKWTVDYMRKILDGIRKNDEILTLLQEAIEIRLIQNQERIQKLKAFNFINPSK